MKDEERHTELASFLRARRQSLQPEQVGLPRRKVHRRTPGLRREDVAELSDISVTWYTWLEQGRSIQVSSVVLNRLADVLQLDVAERDYLFELAIQHMPSLSIPVSESLSPRIQRLLDVYGTNPAYLIGPHFEILAWNQAAADVFFDFAKIPFADRNALAILFSHRMRALIVNWESLAQHVLADFRASTCRISKEPWYISLIEELNKQSHEFRMWWAQHKVQRVPEMCVKLAHPLVGLLVLEQTVLKLHEHPHLRIIVYTPHPETDSAINLQQLTRLRTVTEEHLSIMRDQNM